MKWYDGSRYSCATHPRATNRADTNAAHNPKATRNATNEADDTGHSAPATNDDRRVAAGGRGLAEASGIAVVLTEADGDVERADDLGPDRQAKVIDRCNLTILSEPGFEDLANFLAAQKVEVLASLPCYLEENVDKQRGKGVFEASVVRTALFVAVALYAWGTVWILERWRDSRRQASFSETG